MPSRNRRPPRRPGGFGGGGDQDRQYQQQTTDTTQTTSQDTIGNQAVVAMLTGSPAMQRGDREGEVPVLQEHLNALGLDVGTPDGVFGGGTESAVLRYQSARDITEDGVVGSGAAEAMSTDVASGVTIAQLEASISADLQAQLDATSAQTADTDALAYVTALVLEVVPESLRTLAASAIPMILQQCVAAGVRNAEQVAYILATTEHESDFGETKYSRSTALVEDRNGFSQQADGTWSARVHTNGKTVTAPTQEALEIAYWDSAYGGRLGNESGGSDGRDYRGRGFVQITGEANYEKIGELLNKQGFSYTHSGVTYGGAGNPAVDLVANPEHVNEVPSVAARILVEGSLAGSFTHKALGDYVNDEQTDYRGARAVINNDGATNGDKIAELARDYAAALKHQDAWKRLF